ncbi:MAG: hypothetical protein LIO77_00780 [Rikenellaceae bacterium]|nr:hypothetical protein [Rikenellaceae bacterium]
MVKPLVDMYRFQSFAEYRALLSLYNIGVEKVEGSNKGHRYQGLIYSALDDKGSRVGKPLKSSLLGKSTGIAHLDERMKQSVEALKGGKATASTKAAISGAMKTARTESHLREALHGKGIDLVLRRTDQGRIYGATFIDHKNDTVVNGSRLGKEFSANALNSRFADNSPREDLHAPHRKPSAAGHTVPKPDLGSVAQAAGGLLSILTPDTDGQNNQPMPRKRKKKKRRYGRQM